MIELKNLSLGYKDKLLISNASTFFAKGFLTALIGLNGSGKSTLIRAICGLNNNYYGEISLNSINLKKLSPREISSLIAYVNTRRPQMSNLKCFEVVALGRSPYTAWHGTLSATDIEIVNQALDMVGMGDYNNRLFNTLSDGESQKIMIARAIAQDTDIILLDEPTSFLDISARFDLADLLQKLAHEKGKTIIFSTHELDIALEITDSIALINNHSLYHMPRLDMIKSGLIPQLFKTPNNHISQYLNFLLYQSN